MPEWFYAQDGRQHGPVSEQDLQQMAETGHLRPDDLIWKDGMPEWVPAGETDGLFPAQRAATQYDPPPGAYADQMRPAKRSAYADDWDDRPRARGAGRKRASNKGAMFGVIGGVVALLLVGGVVVYLLNSDKSDSNKRSFSIRIGQFKSYSVKFPKGKVVEITAEAKNGRHLDVFIIDNRGRKIAGAESPTNECRVVFIPESTQAYRVKVVNPRILNRPEFSRTVRGEVRWKIHNAAKMAKRDKDNPPKIVAEREFSLNTGEASTHYVRLKNGKSVEVIVRSKGQSDVDLFIYDESGRKIARDEGFSPHCILVIRPTRTQTYKLQVVNRNLIDVPQRNGFNSGTLKWKVLGPGQQIAGNDVGKKPPINIQPPQPAFPNAQGVRVPPFATQDLLPANAPILPDGHPYRLYRVSLVNGRSYTIEMNSAKFDTFLYLKDDKGVQLGTDDDGGIGLNSRMVFRPLRNGVYRIYASSFSKIGSGPFTLTVR